jgi:hypothetical protein
MAQPFGHFATQPPRYEHRRFVCLQVVKIGSLLSTDFQKIAEAVTRDQTGQCTSMLNERIGGHRGPMPEVGESLAFTLIWASASRSPPATASEGSAAVEETFQTAIRPLFSSKRQISVKVPPESTPIRHAIYPHHSVGDRLAIIMEQSRRRKAAGRGKAQFCVPSAGRDDQRLSRL